MSTSHPDRFILADEKTPRRYGFLNVLFGSILIASNLWMATFFLAFSFLEEPARFAVAAAQVAIVKEHQDDIQQLKEEVAAAPDEETRELAVKRLERIQAEPMPNVEVSLMGMESLQDRRVQIYNTFEVITGLLLNALMIVSGAALIGLREWGRKTAMAVAGIKLARLVLLVSISLFVIVPIQMAGVAKQMPAVMAQAKGRPNNPANVFLSPQVIAAQSTGGVVLNGILATIYPILLLVKLSRKRVQAACQIEAGPPSRENLW